jgi:flagellar protein FliL
MARKLIPVVIILAGLGGGLAAGAALRPHEEPDAAGPAATPDAAAATDPKAGAHAGDDHDPVEGDHASDEPMHEYVKFSNQFVVPVVEDGRVAALVVLSLSLEVAPGMAERVYELEPKLRDSLLQVLFEHANSGGFSGSFTDGANLVSLRAALRETAARVFGPQATDVLIAEIVRQDS